MDIIFLDQNKWIQLARIEFGSSSSDADRSLLTELNKATSAGRAIFPLTASHIIETCKRNDLRSRSHVAQVMARLSRGYVFRSRAALLRAQAHDAAARIFAITVPSRPENWALASGFMQAFEPFDDEFGNPVEVKRYRRINSSADPQQQLLDFLVSQNEENRRKAQTYVRESSASLVTRLEQQRARSSGEALDMRRRVYAARLMIDQQEEITRALLGNGKTFADLLALGSESVQSLMRAIPTFDIEVELAARLEAQPGALEPNDLRDMQSFYTVLPYATRVVAEKAFVNLARQAKMHTRYGVLLDEALTSLARVYRNG